ncbi:MAG TPA: hypothetical protein VJ647_05865 [Chitinophagaceae bacterium]|nr:hypothetical protein [Chitinophagaceae bacterium]
MCLAESKLSVALLNTPVMLGRMFTRGVVIACPSAISSVITVNSRFVAARRSVSVSVVPRLSER